MVRTRLVMHKEIKVKYYNTPVSWCGRFPDAIRIATRWKNVTCKQCIARRTSNWWKQTAGIW